MKITPTATAAVLAGLAALAPVMADETNRFIVSLQDNATPAQVQQLEQQITNAGGSVHTRFTLIKAIVVTVDPSFVSALSSNPLVTAVEPDRKVSINV